MLRRLMPLRDDRGQTTVEYAAVVALVAIVLALALSVIPADLFSSFWNAVQSAL